MSDKRLYIEQRPQGDYAVRHANAARASIVTPTQGRAIEWVQDRYPGVTPHIERVRHTSQGKPDQWRKP